MAIEYDIYQTPCTDKDKKSGYHARVVLKDSHSDSDMVKSINHRCTLTSSDIKGVLNALSEYMIDEFTDGRRVHLEGIGYFYPVISSSCQENNKDINSNSLKIKTIKFKPEREVVREVKTNACFKLSDKKKHSLTAESEITKTLKRYFKDNSEINFNIFKEICSLTTSTAYRYIKNLLSKGILVKYGSSHAIRYVSTEKLFQLQ